MDHMLYIGMNAARATQQAQATAVNNLANASTTGFRSDFHSLLTSEIAGPGHASRFNATSTERASNLDPGPIQQTGRDLDIALQGKGWFAVQDAQGGEAYSRRGDLQVQADGRVLNGAGQPVLGENGPLVLPPHSSVTIGQDGTVSVVPLGQGANTLATVDRLKLVALDETQVAKGDDGLMRQIDGKPGEPSAAVQVISGALEGSNVNAVEAMVDMISLSRTYEMQVKLMATAKELSDAGTRLMRLE